MPQRIQLRRTKGWRKPDSAVVVARPSRWGNPYRLARRSVLVGPSGREVDVPPGADWRAVAARAFRDDLLAGNLDIDADEVRAELAGRDLACWCPLEDAAGHRVPCHADVLLDIAASRAS